MSTHPNAILLLTLTPEDLPMKTYRAILADGGKKEDDDVEFKIGGSDFRIRVMGDGYDENFQVSAKEGDIIVFDMITYGYGEVIEWEKVEALKAALVEWAKPICEKFKCSYKIFITANYW